ncbi:MAG TPA: gfo/Idh/MocA family oxidoreductase, partial [Verrucomicrobiae bacterium]|nr:gfo/Idh/MocA family oxidoreductase [Verrucomicrobiae bacterium]
HFGNFLAAVRSRKSSDLHADILEGHLSSALCHTGNISYRLGRQMPSGELRETLKGNADAVECLGRMQEHLEVNNVDLAKTPATLGVFLKMNPKTERFSGNHLADKMLTREYRAPFVVPKDV